MYEILPSPISYINIMKIKARSLLFEFGKNMKIRTDCSKAVVAATLVLEILICKLFITLSGPILAKYLGSEAFHSIIAKYSISNSIPLFHSISKICQPQTGTESALIFNVSCQAQAQLWLRVTLISFKTLKKN